MFLNYIHNFRGLTIVFIVAAHCVYLSFLTWQDNDMMGKFLYTSFHLSSTLFIFIAGFLFQHLAYKYTFKRYIRSKLQFIILPYIIISIPAIVKIIYFPFPDDPQLFQEYPAYMQALLYYVTGRHMSALWFMPTIIIFYFFAPLLFILDKKPWFYWLLPLFIIVSIFVPREIFPIHNPIQSFVHFFSVYVFGMFVSHYRETIFQYVKQYLGILIGLIILLFILEFYYEYGYPHKFSNELFNLFRWLVFAVVSIYLLYYYEKQIGQKTAWLAEMSFGIYFIHSYVLTLFAKTFSYFEFKLPGNILTFLLVLTMVILMSSVILWIIKKIFGRYSRMLVGY